MSPFSLTALTALAALVAPRLASAELPCVDIEGCSPYYTWLAINLLLESVPPKANGTIAPSLPIDLSYSINNMYSYQKCRYARETNDPPQELQFCVYEVKPSPGAIGQLFTATTCESEVKYGDCLPSDVGGFALDELRAFQDNATRAAYIQRCPASNNTLLNLKLINISNKIAAIPPALTALSVERECGAHEEPAGPGAVIMIVISVVLLLLGIFSETFEYLAHLRAKTAVDRSLTSGGGQYEGDPAEIPLIATTDITGMSHRCNKTSILRYFNLSANFGALFTKSGARSLGGLDGLKGFSMMWIILAHASLFSTFLGTENPAAGKDYVQESDNYFTYSAQFGVDTFFFVSGQLTAYVLSSKLRKLKHSPGAGKFFLFIILRWLRLTPLYAYVLFMYTYVGSISASGPFWFKMVQETYLCHKHWWANLIYVNNFVPHEYHDQCMAWSWYLANDIQFYIVALIVMFLYLKKPQIGVALASGITIICTIIGYIIGVQNDFSTDGAAMQNDFYDKPYCRIPAYTAGLLLGMALRDTRLKKLRLTTTQAFFAMGSCVGMMIFLFYIQATRYSPTIGFDKPFLGGSLKQEWSKYDYALFNSFGRLAYVLALAGMCALNASGNGGIVYNFLTLSFWDPLGKLTFGAYLIHPVLLRIYYYQQHQLYYFNHINQTTVFIAAATLGYGLSMITYVLIELPCDSLIKNMMQKGASNHK